MEYININNDMNMVLAEDKVFSKTELLKQFEAFIEKSGFRLQHWIKMDRAPFECLILDRNNNVYDMILYLKNITGAGWKDKPKIRRAQVSNIKLVSPLEYIPTSNNRSMFILGYYNFDNNPIMVAWDAYRYIEHSTLRSAYINIDNLMRGYESGYVVTTDASQKVWIFDSAHFDIFLNDYILYNK